MGAIELPGVPTLAGLGEVAWVFGVLGDSLAPSGCLMSLYSGILELFHCAISFPQTAQSAVFRSPPGTLVQVTS